MLGAVHDRLAFGPQSGEHQRGAGSDVRRPHGRAGQLLDPSHDHVVRVGADVGSHAHELVDVAEPSAEDVLGHDADAVRERQQHDEQRLVIGRDARIRKRRDVGRRADARGAIAHSPFAVGEMRIPISPSLSMSMSM